MIYLFTFYTQEESQAIINLLRWATIMKLFLPFEKQKRKQKNGNALFLMF